MKEEKVLQILCTRPGKGNRYFKINFQTDDSVFHSANKSESCFLFFCTDTRVFELPEPRNLSPLNFFFIHSGS
ncbi:hypothetical protein N665_0808s0012 [Sinapis alba]|nr:hypothetical protein N665_0808s0012 [Sinapis alba]